MFIWIILAGKGGISGILLAILIIVIIALIRIVYVVLNKRINWNKLVEEDRNSLEIENILKDAIESNTEEFLSNQKKLISINKVGEAINNLITFIHDFPNNKLSNNESEKSLLILQSNFNKLKKEKLYRSKTDIDVELNNIKLSILNILDEIIEDVKYQKAKE